MNETVKVVKVARVVKVKVFQVFQNIPGSQLLSDFQTFFPKNYKLAIFSNKKDLRSWILSWSSPEAGIKNV